MQEMLEIVNGMPLPAKIFTLSLVYAICVGLAKLARFVLKEIWLGLRKNGQIRKETMDIIDRELKRKR